MRDAIFGQGQGQPRGSVPIGARARHGPSRPVWNSGQALQQSQSPGPYGHDPAMASRHGRPAVWRSALWRAASCRRRRRRLVPRHRRGGRRRRGRRLAAAQQHPRHDGRRRQPPGLRRCSGRPAIAAVAAVERSVRQRSGAGCRDQRHRLVQRPRRRQFGSRAGLFDQASNDDDDDMDHDSDGFDDDGGGDSDDA